MYNTKTDAVAIGKIVRATILKHSPNFSYCQTFSEKRKDHRRIKFWLADGAIAQAAIIAELQLLLQKQVGMVRDQSNYHGVNWIVYVFD